MMKKKKAFVLILCSIIALAFVASAYAEQKSLTTTIIRKEGKKSIVFMNDQGKEIASELSGSRTSIMIGGKTAFRDSLKEGMKIKITYDENGVENEPSSIEVLD